MGELDLTKADDRVLTYHGLCISTWLQKLRSELAAKRTEVERSEEFVRQMERELDGVNKELQTRTDPKGIKYHDIGHARTQFEYRQVDGKWIRIPDEELDPVVRAYLERRKVYE